MGKINEKLLSNMTDVNRDATWVIIGQGAAPLFIPPDAFVCTKCAGKVRKAQSVSNSSVPRPEPEPVPQPIIILRVRPPPSVHTHARTRNELARPILCVI